MHGEGYPLMRQWPDFLFFPCKQQRSLVHAEHIYLDTRYCALVHTELLMQQLPRALHFKHLASSKQDL